MKKEYYRHGDLSFHPIEKLPDGLKEVEHQGEFTLAEGEFTGHKHVMTIEKPKEMTILRDPKNGQFYIRLGAPAKLTHQEHKQLDFKPGLYKMNVEREYDYFKEERDRVVKVMD